MSSLTSRGPRSSRWTLSSLPQTMRRLDKTLLDKMRESLHARGMGNRLALSMPITMSMKRPSHVAYSLLSHPGKKTVLRLVEMSSTGLPVPITESSKKLRISIPLRLLMGSSCTSVTRVPVCDRPSSTIMSHIRHWMPCCLAKLADTEDV